MFKPTISIVDREAVVYSDDLATMVFPEPHRVILVIDRKVGSFYNNEGREAIAEWVKSFETRPPLARVSDYVNDFYTQVRDNDSQLGKAFPTTWMLDMIDQSITYEFLAKPEFTWHGGFQGPAYDEDEPAEWEDMFEFEKLEEYLTELSEERVHPNAMYDTYILPYQDMMKGLEIHEDMISGLHLSERVVELIRKNIVGLINDRIVNFRTVANLSFVGFGERDEEPEIHRVNFGGRLGRFNLWHDYSLLERPIFLDATYAGGIEQIEGMGAALIGDRELSFLSQVQLTTKMADLFNNSEELAYELFDEFNSLATYRVTKDFIVRW